MPVVSQSQRRFMYAAEAGKVKGVPKSVGKEFVGASHGVTDLPEHVKAGHVKKLAGALRGKR